MSFFAVATAAVGVGSSILSSRSASKDRKAANKASKNALAFEQQKYNDWQEVYGPLEQNIADYYTTLTPESYASIGLEAFQKEYDRGIQNLETSLIQRGISPDSGIAASLESQAELNAAESRADIRLNADTAVREEQRAFLQIGLNQNPGSTLAQALRSDATAKARTATSSAAAAGEAWQAAIPAVGRAVDAYNRRPIEQTPTTEWT